MQAYVPKLQSVGQVCTFLRWQRGFKIPSSAAFGKIGDGYVKAIHRFADDNGIPVIRFEKGDNKEAIARPLIDAAAAQGGDGRVVLIGIAQEKASVWRSWPAKGHKGLAHPHMERGRQMAFINHFYFYLWDPDWGGAFWNTNAYAPFPIWLSNEVPSQPHGGDSNARTTSTSTRDWSQPELDLSENFVLGKRS